MPQWDEPCGSNLALVVASPAILVALQVYVTVVSTLVTLRILREAALSLYNTWYLASSVSGTWSPSHWTSGLGIPFTWQINSALTPSLVGVSDRGLVNCGACKVKFTMAEQDVVPYLLLRVTVNFPTSSGLVSSMVSLTILLTCSILRVKEQDKLLRFKTNVMLINEGSHYLCKYFCSVHHFNDISKQ